MERVVPALPFEWDRASLAVVVGLCAVKALVHLALINRYGYHGDEPPTDSPLMQHVVAPVVTAGLAGAVSEEVRRCGVAVLPSIVTKRP